MAVCHKTGEAPATYFTRGNPGHEPWEINAVVDAAATVIFEEEQQAAERRKNS